MIREKAEDLGFEIKNLEIYSMTKIQLGMQIDNNVKPIYIKHKPTDTYIICKNFKSQHKNLMKALKMLKEEIEKGD